MLVIDCLNRPERYPWSMQGRPHLLYSPNDNTAPQRSAHLLDSSRLLRFHVSLLLERGTEHAPGFSGFGEQLRGFRRASAEGPCNILNFDLTLMGKTPIDYDVTLMFYFGILGLRHHCIWTWWFFWYIGHKPITYDIYIYVCLCWAWSLKHMIDEMFCVEREALEHMSTYIGVEQEHSKNV